MSDELLKNEGEGEDNETEAHQLRAQTRAQNDEGEGGEDVEAHQLRAQTRAQNDEGVGGEDVEAHTIVRQGNDDDDSDDVEAHLRRA